ncbi:hypothetical protein INT45_002006 [Circinella minor]|uniref:ubiquitinyl hydrolase 1 n=1 Tax=Circinella minor TaxID=1195481 RepID=A0A8H7VT33_9FUNG|nr:hypothetical protein INT45_002006 [Circinella minor]
MLLSTTLEDIQYWLSEVYSCAQIFTAIAGLLAILLPILRSFAIYHQFSDAVSGVFEVAWQRIAWLLSPSSSTSLVTFPGEARVCLGRSDPNTAVLVAGLVNTKNSCFLNVVLQVSHKQQYCIITYTHNLQLIFLFLFIYFVFVLTRPPYSGFIFAGSLLKTIRQLSKPLRRHASFRPRDMVASLLSKRVIINREQQDAQELFQLIVGALDAEASSRNATILGGGLKFFTQTKQQFMHTATPFTGLLASRLSCIHCGYTAALRHFTFNNIQLTVPRAYTTTLDACLRQYTSIEYLKDATCRRCSLVHTLKTLEEQQIVKPKQKRKRLLEEIKSRIKSNRIEDEIDGIQCVKSPFSTKQVMFAKTPKILCLHLSRSAFHASGAVYKNTCQILFPEYLDLSSYTTNGNLCTQPKSPISSPSENTNSNKVNRTALASSTRYRLMSTIVHYGSHSYGHFVAFKRRILPKKCMCPNCQDDKSGPESWEDSQDEAWYRISDSKVDLCSFDVVIQSNPYMLLYELMDQDFHCEEEKKENEENEDVDDLMVAATSSNDLQDNTKSPSTTSPYTYSTSSSTQDAEEALRIANSLLMDDQNSHVTSHWSEARPIISIT